VPVLLKAAVTPALTPLHRFILDLLVSRGEVSGLTLLMASGGALKNGSIYVLLGRLKDKGLIAGREESTGPSAGGGGHRRLYTITSDGRGALLADDARRRKAG
jgi:DNA-binding PadR family transcriptional regulator